MNDIKCEFKSDNKQLTKAHSTDAGYDIYSNEDIRIPPYGSVSISTGLKISVPIGWFGRVLPRSGNSFKNHLETGAGVIDSSYRGEIKIKLYNHHNKEYYVKKGDRIAQLVVMPCYTGEFLKVEKLMESERGDKGFGSSGK